MLLYCSARRWMFLFGPSGRLRDSFWTEEDVVFGADWDAIFGDMVTSFWRFRLIMCNAKLKLPFLMNSMSLLTRSCMATAMLLYYRLAQGSGFSDDGEADEQWLRTWRMVNVALFLLAVWCPRGSAIHFGSFHHLFFKQLYVLVVNNGLVWDRLTGFIWEGMCTFKPGLKLDNRCDCVGAIM